MEKIIRIELDDLKAFSNFRKENPTIQCTHCSFAKPIDNCPILLRCEAFESVVTKDHFCGQFIRKEWPNVAFEC